MIMIYMPNFICKNECLNNSQLIINNSLPKILHKRFIPLLPLNQGSSSNAQQNNLQHLATNRIRLQFHSIYISQKNLIQKTYNQKLNFKKQQKKKTCDFKNTKLKKYSQIIDYLKLSISLSQTVILLDIQLYQNFRSINKLVNIFESDYVINNQTKIVCGEEISSSEVFISFMDYQISFRKNMIKPHYYKMQLNYSPQKLYKIIMKPHVAWNMNLNKEIQDKMNKLTFLT